MSVHQYHNEIKGIWRDYLKNTGNGRQMSRPDYMSLHVIRNCNLCIRRNLVSRSLSNHHRYILWKGNLKNRGVGKKQLQHHGEADRGNDEKSLL